MFSTSFVQTSHSKVETSTDDVTGWVLSNELFILSRNTFRQSDRNEGSFSRWGLEISFPVNYPTPIGIGCDIYSPENETFFMEKYKVSNSPTIFTRQGSGANKNTIFPFLNKCVLLQNKIRGIY